MLAVAPRRPSTRRSTRRTAGGRRPADTWPTRVAKALSHTARISVLQALGEGQTSPSDVAAAASLSVGVVAYHVRELKSAGFVRGVSTQRVRGAVEHFYELTDDGRAAVKALEAVLRHDPRQRSQGTRRKRSTSAPGPRGPASR